MSAAARAEVPIHSILDGMQPPKGYETTHAVICTYSLDLVVAAACIARLAGFGGDDVKVSRVSLATALTELDGRIRLIAQAGRVKEPGNIGPFHALLLKHVSEQAGSAPGTHWHPKLVLVRFASRPDSAGSPIWRFWLGSHNFVRSTNWELGGSLTTESGRRRVSGLSDEIAGLLDLAELPVDGTLRAEIANLKWNSGEPNPVSSVLLPGAAGRRWNLDAATTEAIIVSPFLDWRTLGWLAESVPTGSRLLTTRAEIERLAHGVSPKSWAVLDHFAVLVLGAPDELPSNLEIDEAATDDDEELPERGLHAKALFSRVGHGAWRLQFGSANATRLGMGFEPEQRNGEVVATTSLSETDCSALLAPILQSSVQVHSAELGTIFDKYSNSDTPSETDPGKLLEKLVETVRFDQTWTSIGVVLTGTPIPDPPAGFTLSASTLLSLPKPTVWVRGTGTVSLPPIPACDISDFVVLHLTETDVPNSVGSILVQAPCTPSRTREGDAMLLRRALGPRGLIEWLRGRLDGIAGDDTEWTRKPGEESDEDDKGTLGKSFVPNPISLETVLRAYARDATARHGTGKGSHGASLVEIDRELDRMGIAAFAEPQPDDTDDESRARKELRTFLTLWAKVKQTLLPKRV